MVKDVAAAYYDPSAAQVINPDSNPANLTVMNGSLYFSTLQVLNTPGSVLYKSDGTGQGTVAVKRINSDSVDSEEPYAIHLEPIRFTVVGDQLFFIAGTHIDWLSATNENVELWRSDGTDAGTHQVKDIFPFNFGSSRPSKLREVNGKLVFSAYTEDYGREPWVSDGTEGGTFMLKDIHRDLHPGTTYGQDSESHGRSYGEYQYE
jgi:ELWxxDGT repeat protein